jgi:hypothetical protein
VITHHTQAPGGNHREIQAFAVRSLARPTVPDFRAVAGISNRRPAKSPARLHRNFQKQYLRDPPVQATRDHLDLVPKFWGVSRALDAATKTPFHPQVPLQSPLGSTGRALQDSLHTASPLALQPPSDCRAPAHIPSDPRRTLKSPNTHTLPHLASASQRTNRTSWASHITQAPAVVWPPCRELSLLPRLPASSDLTSQNRKGWI